MNYGNEEDSFSVPKLIGQIALVLAILAYMWFDRDAA